MNDVLREIVAATRADLARRTEKPVSPRRREPGRLRIALQRGTPPRIIAEIKAASPSAGAIALQPDVEKIAEDYRRGGASAISVVTEPRYFRGSTEWVSRAARVSGLPVLMKDFIVDPVQIYDAANAGADGLLLIAAILPPSELRRLSGIAREAGLDPVVEVHNHDEVLSAMRAGADIVGVNNRNLHDFSVQLSISEKLGQVIPDSVVRITESGIKSRGDVERLRRAGFDNFLVGESLLRSDSPFKALLELRGVDIPGVKICGITRPEDAVTAAEAGAFMVGVIFADGSPRKVTVEQAREIRHALPRSVNLVGVFRNQPADEIRRVVDQTGINFVQLHGNETPEEMEQIQQPLIKAFGIGSTVPDTSGYGKADFFLFDAATPGAGHQFDWTVLRAIRPERAFFLAGGINPSNVAEAVNVVRPHAIDVSSGVESAPGIKSKEKIHALFAALKDSGLGTRDPGP